MISGKLSLGTSCKPRESHDEAELNGLCNPSLDNN